MSTTFLDFLTVDLPGKVELQVGTSATTDWTLNEFNQKARKRNFFNICDFGVGGGTFTKMSNFLIIGGGFSGVLLGHVLTKRGIAFKGLEKTRQLSSQFNFKQLRLYNDSSVGFLNDLFKEMDWQKIDDQPKERKKGDWVSAGSEFIDEEMAFLGNPVYCPTESFDSVFNRLKSSVEKSFLTDKAVEKIDLERKIVFCADGSEFPFESLVWCADLKSLLKAVDATPQNLSRSQKKKSEPQGGIHLEVELSQSLLPFKNSIVFPFRYKEFKLRAIGLTEMAQSAKDGLTKMHWLVFIERELAEDREEVAKVIRALKRELQKEFPDLKSLIQREKIVFEPKVETYNPTEIKGLELFPGIYYVGPQAQLSDTLGTGSPLDLTVENLKRFENTLSAQG